MAAIEVEGLRKRFRGLRKSTTAVDGLSFSVPEGSVFGFLGPNGAGKTTTIRCLLGLIAPTEGSTSIHGCPSSEIHRVIARVGATIEGPGFFGGFSARVNLEHLSRLAGRGGHDIEATLAKVGLTERADDRVSTFSTGMKQRLALGAALMRDPDVLILDEPAQGLDPEGIRDIREIITSVAADGRTILLSSHLLSEVQSICDQVAIISEGELVRQGKVSELLDEIGTPDVIVIADDPSAAEAVLVAAGFDVALQPDGVLVRAAESGVVNQILSEAKVYANEVRSSAPTLEQVYLRWREGG